MNTNQITIGKKLTGIVGGLLALLLVLSGLSLFTLYQMKAFYRTGVEDGVEKTRIIGQIQADQAKLSQDLQGYLMYTMTQAADKAAKAKSDFEGTTANLDSEVAKLKKVLDSTEGRRQTADIEKGLADWKGLFGDITGAVGGGKLDEALKIAAERATSVHESTDRKGAEVAALAAKLSKENQEATATLSATMLWLTIALIALGVTVGMFSLFMVLRETSKLRRVAAEIGDGAEQVASAAQQVSSASSSVAQSASEQAASLEETSASTEELNSMTQKNAENAHTASAETTVVDQLLSETNQRLDQMISSMREINTSSEKISKIIKVIDEIAFQTNILALNAAVEAARAGEAGMGFAVVADEVRNLAQRCAQAAKDTSELIEESITRSNEGKSKLDEVVVSIAKVVQDASKIKILANEVHVGSQEQARGIDQISRAITQMQSVTQSTAASAEESASAGEEMSAQANNLREAVRRLRDVVGTETAVLSGVTPNSQARKATNPAGKAHANVATLASAVDKASGPSARPQASKDLSAARQSFPLDGDFSDF